MKSEGVKYNSFDLAKLICSILVVMIHVAPFGEQVTANASSYLNFGLSKCLCRIAVPLFFILNGFFLYGKTPLDKFNVEHSKKYVLHILKIYLVWSLIYLPLNLSTIVYNPNGILFGIGFYLRNFICIGSYNHLWYLVALLFAVMLISFLLYKKWSPKKILCVSAFFCVLGLFGDGYNCVTDVLLKLPVVGEGITVYNNIFNTTRNGLFFAFFFVSLGMVLSEKEISISRKKSLLFFVVSLLMLFIEVCVITYFDIARDWNILIFTIPAALFCFMFLKTIELKDFKVDIRTISSLIFYGHLWVYKIVSECFDALGIYVQNTPLPFIVVVVITVLISVIVVKLSDNKYFKWLKNFY